MPQPVAVTVLKGTVSPREFAPLFKAISEGLINAAKGEGEITILTPGLFGYRSGTKKPNIGHMIPDVFLRQMDHRLEELKRKPLTTMPSAFIRTCFAWESSTLTPQQGK
jgi:hypothetical protein